jgi:hypothetical protein
MAGIVLAVTGGDFLEGLVVVGLVCDSAAVVMRQMLKSVTMERMGVRRLGIRMFLGGFWHQEAA